MFSNPQVPLLPATFVLLPSLLLFYEIVAAAAAAINVAVADRKKRVSSSSFISLSIRPTISSIVSSSSVAASFASTLCSVASSPAVFSKVRILRSPVTCSTRFVVERRLWAASRCASWVWFFSFAIL